MKIDIDQVAVESVMSLLGDLKDKYPTVMSRSINRTLSTAQTQAVARIGNVLNLTASRIKQDFVVQTATTSSIQGAVLAKGAPVGLVQFGAVDGPYGVTVKVLKQGTKSLLKHAYLAPGKKSSGLHVWWRQNRMRGTGKFPVGVKSYAPWPKFGRDYSLPISRLTGPRIEDIYAKPEVLEPVQIQSAFVYLKYVDDEVSAIIRRFG